MKFKIFALVLIMSLVLFIVGCNQQTANSSEQKQNIPVPESKNTNAIVVNKTLFAANNNVEIKVISYRYETYYDQKVLRVDLKLTNKGSKEFHFSPGDPDWRSKAVDVEGHEYDIIQDGTLYINDIIYPLNSVEGYLLFGKTHNTPKIDHLLLGLGWYDQDPIGELLNIKLSKE